MSGQPSPTDVESFRSVLARETGLRFDDDKLPLLTEVLSVRLRETKSATVASYLGRLASTPQEVAELAHTLTISETYFFRNRDQFRALEAILLEREASPARHLRLLSAGCSSGEEAYSLAMAIREAWQSLDEWNVSILGIDLNPQAIERARTASYTRWALRETPEVIREKYFRVSGTHYTLIDAVRGMVRFDPQNLVHPTASFWRSEAFDIVFCRNVLMYFVPEVARAVVTRIARCLAPGGHLFLGHAENLRGLSQDFHLRHSHDTFYYKRRGALRSRIPATARVELPRIIEPSSTLSTDTSWFEAIARASRRIEKLSRDAERGATPEAPPQHGIGALSRESSPTRSTHHDLLPAMDLMKQERFQEALRLLAGAPAAANAQPEALLLRAMLLVSTGELAGAEELCEELLTLDELNAGAHYIIAICREHVGDRDGSIEHSQAAAYLDSEFAMPHLQLGRLARRSGDIATARRELELALGLLPREDAARIILFGGGFSREALMQLCRGELTACGGDR